MDIGKISSWKELSGIVTDSRTVVEPPSLEMFKKCVEDLRTWFEGASGLMILEVFSSLSDSDSEVSFWLSAHQVMFQMAFESVKVP